MKVNYKNWVPKNMVIGLITATGITMGITAVFAFSGLLGDGMLKRVLTIVFALVLLICAAFALWSVQAYCAFSYNGKRKLSKQIIEGVADYITVPDGSKILDVGCGSGALTIACAKRNQGSTVVGIDRWGAEYASFSKQLCENNAIAEGINNTKFMNGNAVHLDFPDENFDAVTSNYVYHNITGQNKQKLLNETLRVLKKGGVFAIHDLMSPSRYGDMNAFLEELRNQGYQKVELIDTANGIFMTKMECRRLKLFGSTILYGIK